MPALNFQPQWAPAVEAGLLFAHGKSVATVAANAAFASLPIKRMTIRKDNQAISPGRMLYLFTGLRTKKCRRLGEAMCLSTTRIRVMDDYTILGNQVLYPEQWEYFARLDTAGLWSGDEVRAYLKKTYGLPFTGILIGW